MPLFYFDLIDCSGLGVDPAGMELPDAAAARKMAIRGARDIMRMEMQDGRLDLDCTFVIMDSDRAEIARVPFSEAVEVTGG